MKIKLLEPIEGFEDEAEVRVPVDGDWFVRKEGGIDQCNGYEFKHDHMRIVLKKKEPPKPKLVPWTFHDNMIGRVWIRVKGYIGGQAHMPINVNREGVEFYIGNGHHQFVNWLKLMEDFEYADYPSSRCWSPCGIDQDVPF